MRHSLSRELLYACWPFYSVGKDMVEVSKFLQFSIASGGLVPSLANDGAEPGHWRSLAG